jgi:hypothetical protein
MSWLAERLITWTAWGSAAISLVGAVAYYLNWNELDGTAQMALGAVLFTVIAFWRQNALAQKHAAYRDAAYRDAVSAYEAMLAQLAS